MTHLCMATSDWVVWLWHPFQGIHDGCLVQGQLKLCSLVGGGLVTFCGDWWISRLRQSVTCLWHVCRRFVDRLPSSKSMSDVCLVVLIRSIAHLIRFISGLNCGLYFSSCLWRYPDSFILSRMVLVHFFCNLFHIKVLTASLWDLSFVRKNIN